MSGVAAIADLGIADLTVEIIRDAGEVAALAPEWDALLAGSTCNRAFSSSRWFLTWLAVEPTLGPRVLTARRDGVLAGVLPLVATSDGTWRFPGELADYNDAVVERGDLATAAALLDTVKQGASRLELACLRPDSNLAGALTRLEPGRDLEGLFRGAGTLACPYIELGDGYEAYLATRGSDFRNKLRRAWRRAEARGLEVRELDPRHFPPAELPEVFLALHTERIPRSCFIRFLERAFAEAALPVLFTERRLRAFAVFDGVGVVGISLYMAGDRGLGHWNGGFHAAAAHCAPGKLLLDTAIRTACREGLEEIDLMRGDEAYKANWSTGSRTIARLEVSLATKAAGGGAAS